MNGHKQIHYLSNRVVVLCVAVALAASSASAQRVNTIKPTAPTVQGAVTVDGVVRDPDGRLLSAAEVMVDATHHAISNARGEFSISGLEPGTIEFTTRRIGYTPITSAVKVEPGVTAVHLAVKLVPISVQLGTIVVQGKRLDKTLWQTGFYKRQDTGRGVYFDDETLRHYQGSIATLIGTANSVYVERASNGVAVAYGRLPSGASCPLSVFVDGNYLSFANEIGIDDVINRDDVLAVEVYPRASEMPSRIAGLGGTTGVGSIGSVNIQGAAIGTGQVYAECGVILLWTKPLPTKKR
jgi:hypothetical protein